MINNKIKQMADKLIPEDLRSILLSVDSDVKWAILSDLSEGDKSFTELKKDLEIDNKSLSYNLYKLLENGVITHYYKHEFFKPDFSFYRLTNIGKGIIKSIDYIFYVPGDETQLETLVATDGSLKPAEPESGELVLMNIKPYTEVPSFSLTADKRNKIRLAKINANTADMTSKPSSQLELPPIGSNLGIK